MRCLRFIPEPEAFVRRHLIAALLLAAVPVTLAVSRTAEAARLATQDVTIDARCTGGSNTQVTLRPWNLRIKQGDDVRWVLNANANSNDITITPKNANWPFDAKPPYRGSKAQAARSGGMKGNARGRYSYTVQLICTNGPNADTVTVDPDVIVD